MGYETPGRRLGRTIITMEYLNTDEVAAHLRLTRRTIYHLIRSGQLIAFQSQKRGRLRFTKLQLDEYAKKMM